ncbi:ABC transporter permease subunit [Dactylosporangium vinaceum]|uniref:ABC transporter permease subunit n=1 Tax=Dactylosporangium vinaceum TaxID=53362 RepID=A0ABV5MRK1_9ACTN|nr:ABC transporter permease subunit [Dactylosporangium vinaceum]UAC00419.1 ABC transporter permease subunit [Dactylosporangium vinaceum]
MTWLAVRLLRPYLIGAAALGALLTTVILAAAATVQDRLDALGRPDCLNPNLCYQAGTPVLLMQLTAAFGPALIGLLLGVPLFAGERADDTIAFALTQSVPRGRWVLGKFGVALCASVLVTGVVATVYRLVAARYTVLANDTYELLDLFHLNNIAFMVMRAVLTLSVAALLGLLTGSTLRTAILSVVLWPFGLLAACGVTLLLPVRSGASIEPVYAPTDDRYWAADITYLDPLAWPAAGLTVLYVIGLVLLMRRSVGRKA